MDVCHSSSSLVSDTSASDQVNGTSMSDHLHEVETAEECNPGETGASSKQSQPPKDSTIGLKNINSQIKPEVGMVFHSEEQAYRFYNSFAKRRGFSVRKGHRSRRKDGTTRVRIFLCSNEGSRQQHRTHVTKKPRALVRTNCLARIEYKVNRDNIWIVSKITDEHNHPLMAPNTIHMLRSHRKRLLVHRSVYNEIRSIPCSLQEEQDHVFKNQTKNFPSKRARDLEKGDAQFLLDILRARQSEDPSFFYAIQLDERERPTNFFWADTRSTVDYACFGDAVSFDTTYRASVYDVPFAPFLGVNHHTQIVVFGAAFLLDETVGSFVWLFKTFLAAMSGRQPKTIFTDHCVAMAEAVRVTLPETSHQLCLWQILQNVPRHLSHVYNTEPSFQKEFKNCIYESGSENGFFNGWNSLISKYNLQSNSWLEELYSVREKWALGYCRNSFCATMATAEWGERMSNCFKMYFYRKLPPSKFLAHYHKALVELRERELLEDSESRQSKPTLLVDVPMLNVAAESYTRTVYRMFEDEYKSQLACLCEPVGFDGTVYTFRVSLPRKQCHGVVGFNAADAMVSCSCKKFEYMGILCMHALKVLNNNNILHLSPRYILKRWTNDARVGVFSSQDLSTADPENGERLSMQYSRIWRKAVDIAVRSTASSNALEFVEGRLDKFMLGMEQVLHSATSEKDREDGNGADSVQDNTIDADVICFDAFV